MNQIFIRKNHFNVILNPLFKSCKNTNSSSLPTILSKQYPSFSSFSTTFSRSSSTSSSNNNNNNNSTKSNKSSIAKLWDQYSVGGQQRRILLGERLFRAAQWRAMDPTWYGPHKISPEFRPQHALLTMHIWFLHRRLLADTTDPHFSLLVQEELFDIFWNDTKSRIRANKVHELTVSKHLKDAQRTTFVHCTQYDHAFSEFKDDEKKRFEVICDAVWRYVLGGEEDASEELIRRLGAYVEYQFENVVFKLPDDYFSEGRIAWGSIPDLQMFEDGDNDSNSSNISTGDDENDTEEGRKGKTVVHDDHTSTPAMGMEFLSEDWVKVLTDAGDPYYWNTKSNETCWNRPNISTSS